MEEKVTLVSALIFFWATVLIGGVFLKAMTKFATSVVVQ
jgi:hypothetical protein